MLRGTRVDGAVMRTVLPTASLSFAMRTQRMFKNTLCSSILNM